MLDAMDTALSALDAFGVAQAVAANNVANVNTDGFDPSSVRFEDRPDQGGVAVAEVRESDVQGPPVPAPPPEAAQAGEGGPYPPGYVEGSGTDIATEMVNMMVNEQGFAANAAVVRTADEMLGTLLDDMV